MDSDGSLFRADSLDPLAGGDDDITWILSGDMERVDRIAYAYINIDGPSDPPSSMLPCSRWHPRSTSRRTAPRGAT